MADWTGPFHLPKFTDEKFEEQKQKYHEKHGYTIDVPALGDIIKLRPFPAMTERETELWTGKAKDVPRPRVELTIEEIKEWMRTKKTSPPRTREMTAAEVQKSSHPQRLLIPEARLLEITKEKANKKRKYLTMLASPSPKIVRDAGAILTALDDLQDAVATFAVVARIAAVVVGLTATSVLAGPLGWIVGASTLLSLINPYSRLRGPRKKPATGRKAKKDLEKLTDKNPFSKKARAKVAKNIRRFRPGVSNAIEALQVTNNIFGVGISLGPIMGFAQDVLAGGIRKLFGQKVNIKLAGETPSRLAAKAGRAMKSLAVVHGERWKSDFDAEMYSFMAANLACQVLQPYIRDNNPFEKIDDLANYEIEANQITDPLWIEIFEESGHTAEEYEIWPQNGQRWISYGDLQAATDENATENLRTFANENRNSSLAFIAGQNAHDFALGMIETIEGLRSVIIEYSIIERIVLIILDNGWAYPDDITDAQVEKFEDWCYVKEYMNAMPSYKEIWRYAEVWCGFLWVKSLDEER